MSTDVHQETNAPSTWIPSDDTFGARLALIRQRMGWGNVKKAAEECGLPVQSWRTWERDGVSPNRLVTIALAIATRTGCDYLWLVHGPDRGGAIRRTAYIGQTVIATVGQPRQGRPNPAHTAGPTTRPVRQTRPTGRVNLRPLTPAVV